MNVLLDIGPVSDAMLVLLWSIGNATGASFGVALAIYVLRWIVGEVAR